MANKYDIAVLEWCNDQLENAGLPRDAKGLRFGYNIGCYSEYTHDYDVNATIERKDGGTYTVDYVWSDVISQLPEYIEAQEDMFREHAEAHDEYGWEEDDNWDSW